jgi:tetratricopeptide (TPR) repeat protein
MPPRKTRAPLPFGLATEVGIMLLAVGVPAALGGVHRPAILCAALLACLVVLSLWLYRRATYRGLRVPWFGCVLCGATVFTAFQLLPLPTGLLRLLAPASVEALEVSLAGAGGLPSFHPISLDVGATLLETLKIGTCALAFIVAHNHLYRRERRDRLLVVLVAGAVLLALLGFIGAVAAPGKPLMLYAPEQTARAGGLITTSFVNPNHGSAFLALCTVLAVGLAMTTRDLQARVLLALGSVLLGGAVFVTLSRGGILALALALAAFAVLVAFSRAEGRRPRRAALLPGAAALILALAAWLAYDAIVSELRTIVPELESGLGKTALWPSGWAMAVANPLVGVGRGAFMTAFPRYLGGEMPRTTTYSHLENQYLHLPTEWGLVVAGVVILAAAAALVLWIWRGRRDAPALAMAAALIALAGHAAVDFNMETLGIALPAAVLAGLLSGGYRRDPETDESLEDSFDRRRSSSNKRSDGDTGGEGVKKRRTTTGSRRLLGRGRINTACVLTMTGGLAALTAVAALWDRPTPDEDLAAINLLIQDRAPEDRVLEAVRAAVQRHPADPWPHLAAGRALLAERDPAALRWLNRATFLFPGSPQVHLDTARALRRFRRRRQALLEYRLALKNGAPIRGTLVEALPLGRNADEVASILPSQMPEVHADAARVLLGQRRVDVARKVAAAARRRWPASVPVASAEVEVLLAAKEPERAVQAARTLARRDPLPETFQLWARAAAHGAPGAELPVLRDARRRFPDEDRFSFALADAYLRAKQIKKAMTLAEEIQRRASSTAILIQAHLLLSRVHAADGRPHRARYEAEQARKLRGGR